jgi:hypothetical protein
MFYTYNGDLFDEPSGAGPGYGSDLGILGIRTLEGVYADSDGNDGTPLPEPYERYGDKTSGWGDGIVGNERLGLSRSMYHTNPSNAPWETWDPQTSADFFNYMRGLWRDGTPLTFNESYGYFPEGGTACSYIFPGESDPLHWGTDGIDPGAIWTEESAGLWPGDRRGLISSGPFTFAPGDVQYIDYAFIFARESQNPDEDVLTTLRAYADEVVNLTCENLPDVIVSNSEASQIKTSVQLYPNPSADVVTLSIQPATYGTYTITDLSGRKVASGIIAGSDTRLDLTSFSNGMYIVAIETANTQTSKKLLVGN